MSDTKVVILAAGMGKRLGGQVPKALARVGDGTIMDRLLRSVADSGVTDKPVVVYGHKGELICDAVVGRADCALQERQLGTADAVRAARSICADAQRVVVLYGDHPLVSGETIKKLVDYHAKKPSPILMAVGEVQSYAGWQSVFRHFGRIIRAEGDLIHNIREYKDASAQEREIKEVNPGYYVFDAAWLWHNIEHIGNNNAQGEYYLTDLVHMAVAERLPVRTYKIPIKECIGVNTPEDLELANKMLDSI